MLGTRIVVFRSGRFTTADSALCDARLQVCPQAVKELEPDWTLWGVVGVEQLPAVRWKLENLAKMPKQKHRLAVTKLKAVLDL
jgi:hypothetical protein